MTVLPIPWTKCFWVVGQAHASVAYARTQTQRKPALGILLERRDVFDWMLRLRSNPRRRAAEGGVQERSPLSGSTEVQVLQDQMTQLREETRAAQATMLGMLEKHPASDVADARCAVWWQKTGSSVRRAKA